MPLHTLIELEPRPDGTMVERRYKVNIDSTSDDDVRPLSPHFADNLLPTSCVLPSHAMHYGSISVCMAKVTSSSSLTCVVRAF